MLCTQTSSAFLQRRYGTVRTFPKVAHHFSAHVGVVIPLQLVFSDDFPSADFDPWPAYNVLSLL